MQKADIALGTPESAIVLIAARAHPHWISAIFNVQITRVLASWGCFLAFCAAFEAPWMLERHISMGEISLQANRGERKKLLF